MTIEKQVHEQEVKIRKLIEKLDALDEKIKMFEEKLKVQNYELGVIHEWKLQKEGI